MTAKNRAFGPSFLFVPGANHKAIEKAKSLDAGTLIFDLEDAVSPNAKLEARGMVCKAIASGGYGRRNLIIRINAPDTEWFEADITAAIEANCTAILIPKISSKSDIEGVDEFVRTINNGHSIALWAMIETPFSILNVAQICATANALPLQGLILGLNDLAKAIGTHQSPSNREPFHFVMGSLVTAASAYRISAIDAVFNDITDTEGFTKQAEQAKAFGFDGKCLIHPSQIAPCNQIFAPSIDEIENAMAVVAAFSESANQGKAVINVNGQMAELLHLEMAQSLLARANLLKTMV